MKLSASSKDKNSIHMTGKMSEKATETKATGAAVKDICIGVATVTTALLFGAAACLAATR